MLSTAKTKLTKLISKSTQFIKQNLNSKRRVVLAIFIVGFAAVGVYTLLNTMARPVYRDNWEYWAPRIRWCESGNNYRVVSASGKYRGAWQFDQRTWNSSAPAGWAGKDPITADSTIQDTAAYNLFLSRGTQPWFSEHCWLPGRKADNRPQPDPPLYIPGRTPTVTPGKISVGGKADFNGDGYADILWYQPGSKGDTLYYGTSTPGRFTSRNINVDGVYTAVIPGDFNGDGYSDLLFYGAGEAGDYMWYGTKTQAQFINQPISITGRYDMLVPGDFNGDGKDDILFYGKGNAGDHLYYGTATRGRFTGRNISVSGSYTALIPGDFNGDKRTDILFYGSGAASDFMWYGTRTLGGFTHQPINITGSNYEPLAGDFNGDGRDDILWYGPGRAADYMYYGTATRGRFTGRSINAKSNFTALIPGDFNGDKRTDILFYGSGAAGDHMWFGTKTLGKFSGRDIVISGSGHIPVPSVRY